MIGRIVTVIAVLLSGLLCSQAEDQQDPDMNAKDLLKQQYEMIMAGTARPSHFLAFKQYLTAEKQRYEIAEADARNAGKGDKADQIRTVALWYAEQESLLASLVEVERQKLRTSSRKNDEATQLVNKLNNQKRILVSNLADVRSNPPKIR